MICNYRILVDPDEYQPGTPGKVWTEEEVDIVREKIRSLLYPPAQKNGMTETVLFQLSFHDCLTYKDGSPGCDGCLNWAHMGEMPPSPFSRVEDRYCKHQFDKPEKTDNNGMSGAVETLERVYLEKDYPENAPETAKSLKNLGISRADLWQFAANVALEGTIERSDTSCRHDYYYRQQVPLLEDEKRGFAYGVWKCKIKLTKPIKMQFGRSDCIATGGLDKPYQTDKEENHSNAHANIDEIIRDVNGALGMSARDLIALTSIHGLINPFGEGSIGTKYTWVGSGASLTNMYYKIIANKPMYAFGKGSIGRPMINAHGIGNIYPAAIGDEDGNPVAHHGMRVTCSDCWNTAQDGFGGPCVFRPTMATAPDAPNRDLLQRPAFDKFENGERVADTDGVSFTTTGIQKGNKNSYLKSSWTRQTTFWNNMFMLNYEAGFYRKFDVDPEAFRGTGCPGIDLETPNVMWGNGEPCSEHGSGPIKDGSNSVVASPAADCPVQDLIDEEGTSIAEITEQYANDHDVWASDFLDAWQRMQAIKCTNLKDGPENSWLGYYSLKEMGADIGENYLGFYTL